MDPLDLALSSAWNRLAPTVRADRLECRARADRRFLHSFQRPVRPWCLCLRASDTRITPMNTFIYNERDWRNGEPHTVTLEGEDIQKLCAPVRLEWPGIDHTIAAARLGVTRAVIHQWIKRGILEHRTRTARQCGKRGPKVPHVWTYAPLDPNMHEGAAPDPHWGTLWQYLHEKIPKDLAISITRVHQQHGSPSRDTALFNGWSFLCPGRLLPAPAHLASTTPTPFMRSLLNSNLEDDDLPVWSLVNPDHPIRIASKLRSGNPPPRLITIDGLTCLHLPCGQRVRRLFLPIRPWTMVDHIGDDPLDLSLSLTDSQEKPRPRRGRPPKHPLPPARAGHPYDNFACQACWSVQFTSLRSADGWSQFVSLLSGGLLYGHEVPRPTSLEIKIKRRPFTQPNRRSDIEPQLTNLLIQTRLTSRQIAGLMKRTPATISIYTHRIYKKHHVHTRAQLRAKLSTPTSPCQAQAAS